MESSSKDIDTQRLDQALPTRGDWFTVQFDSRLELGTKPVRPVPYSLEPGTGPPSLVLGWSNGTDNDFDALAGLRSVVTSLNPTKGGDLRYLINGHWRPQKVLNGRINRVCLGTS